MVTFATNTPTTPKLTIAGATHPGIDWQNARDRATEQHIMVIPGKTLADWQTTSASRKGLRHTVNGHCDCEAAQHNKLCMHLAAVRNVQMHKGMLRQCSVCHSWDYVERMEHVAENNYTCVTCPAPVGQTEQPKPTRKPATRLEDLYQD